MAFCNLPAGQLAVLMFIEAATSKPDTPAGAGILKLIQDKDWTALQLFITLGTPPGGAVPSLGDVATVGNMSSGLRNAYFLLAMIDVSGTDDAKSQLQQALNTHCWDWVAQTLLSNLTVTGLTFTGADLHQAYAPNDNSACQMPPQPTAIEKAIGEMIKDGKLVGDFFSKSLPDFFEHDFANFFKDTIPDFFKGPFADFFKDIGNNIKDAFESFGNDVKNAFEQMGEKLNPANW